MLSRMKAMGIVALAPYMVLSQSAFPIAAGSSDIRVTSRMLIAEAKSSPDSSPAVSGVKLLHEIFQKLRNSNQLALNYPNKQLAAASQAIQGSLNPLLIRPSEKSSSQNSQLAYLQQSKKSFGGYTSAYAGEPVEDKEMSKRRAKVMSAAPSSTPAPSMAGASNSGFSMDGMTDIRTNMGSNVTIPGAAPTAVSSSSSASSATATSSLAKGSTRGRLVPAYKFADRPDIQQQSVPQGLSPQNAQMLARSVSKLMQSTRQLSELSQAESSASVKTFGKAKSEMRDERTISTRPGGPVIQEYNAQAQTAGSGGKDFSAATTAANLKNMDDYASGAPLLTPDQPGQYKYLRSQLMALLPPSVVGGIPIARLGATEHELGDTLSRKNNASKQIIDDWTVWTITDSGAHGTCSVQLYLRHSVVEAIRVFQPSYLGEEIGIKIGDNLSTIKGKFGEPAFILSEPGLSGHGASSQNYVYPISHVAFQLARAKTQPSPQVVSVLIFDVQ